jgi:SAM-dependent methyltransferase
MTLPSAPGRSRDAFRRGLRGQVPQRYADDYIAPFVSRYRPALTQGVRVLDVGAGRRPTIPPDQRPAGTHYVGLDASGSELEQAADGYDDVVIADIELPVSALVDQFDLIVSFDVLEHVGNLDAAIENLHRYLKPGGRLVAQFSGRYAAFAIANRVLPAPLVRRLVARIMHRPAETVFAAHYDRCYHSQLVRLLAPFTSSEVVCHYRGCEYFQFFAPALAVYAAYEEWAARGPHRNLATHYLVVADR